MLASTHHSIICRTVQEYEEGGEVTSLEAYVTYIETSR
jgi:hypothetical protein